MIESEIDISGLKELEAALLGLGADLGAKTLRTALRDAAKPIHQKIKQNAPVSPADSQTKVKDIKSLSKRGKSLTVGSGMLKDRVKIRSRMNKKSGKNRRGFKDGDVAIVSVGVHRAYYAYFIEYGTSERGAKPFIRPAVSESAKAVSLFKTRLIRRIELARRKLVKKR